MAGQDLAQRTPRGQRRSQSSLSMRVTGDYDAGHIFSLQSAEARQHDTGHRLVIHALQFLALYNFKSAVFKKEDFTM